MRKFRTLGMMIIVLLYIGASLPYNVLSSTDQSMTNIWMEDVRLSFDDYDSSRPDIGMDNNGTLHVVWSTSASGVGRVYYRMFDGVSWSEIEQIDRGDEDATDPALCVDRNNNVHVVYVDVFSYTRNNRLRYFFISHLCWELDNHR
ncbi:MAG: hypothetical protein DRN20_03840 [Thermoplasmata archaeon]|nr:MAG: hypothetical protein DRN20_03840 [Thermoplasmata archaeon]